MGDLAKQLAAAYAAVEPVEVVVAEWGRSLFVRPATIKQLSAISAASSDPYELTLTVLAVCAKNADGTAAFSKSDIVGIRTFSLAPYDAGTIDRVSGEILRAARQLNVDDEAVDNAVKK